MAAHPGKHPAPPQDRRSAEPGRSPEELEHAESERKPAPAPRKRTRQQARAFYSIGEVCEMLGLKPHVLRYWETQFGALAPTKNRAGKRVYEADEIELIALIRRLVHDERYTIEGAKQRIAELEAEGVTRHQSSEALHSAMLGALASELQSVLDLLDSPAG